MAYAATGDIIPYVGRGEDLSSINSPVSTADIEEILGDIAADIDSVLARLDVTLPLTSGASPKAWKVVHRLNSIGAAAYVELRLFGEATPAARGTTRHEILLKEYRNGLDDLLEGNVLLSDAEGGLTDDSELAGYGGYKDADGRVVDPYFKRADKY